jgi:hypothetical protein
MNDPMQPNEAVIDLLIKKAVEGLSAGEEAALNDSGMPVQGELQRFERAAAAFAMTGLHPLQDLPAGLRQKLLQEGARQVSAANAPVSMPAPRRDSGKMGWWAAAACLLLALFVWNRGSQPRPAPAPQSLRAQLLARADSVRINWSATADPNAGGISGDLVWNPATQSGVMRFVGMTRNDPAVHQYQLWIFDAERDERYPVDGGVFDVPAGATEVLVPIRAALPVGRVKLFAVTLEKPGGVVVSQREHILVTAQPG